MLPFLIGALVLFKNWLATNSPNTAQYDLLAEAETLFFICVKMIFFILATWGIMKIVVPKLHEQLVDIYHKYLEYASDIRKLKEIQILALKAFAIILFSLVFMSAFAIENTTRKELNDYLHTQLHVRELTGKNDGPEVEKYLAATGLGKGHPWCAAFTTYNLNAFNIPNPKSAWSPSWAMSKDIVWQPKGNKANNKVLPGDCFTLFYPKLNRVGHVGFVVDETFSHFITIEGNTNDGGSREGDGVYKKKREKSKVHAVTNYITPYFEKHEHEKNILIRVSCTNVCKLPTAEAHSYHSHSNRYGNHYHNHSGARYTYTTTSRQFNSNYALQRHDYYSNKWSISFGFEYKQWASASTSNMRSFGATAEIEGYNYQRAQSAIDRGHQNYNRVQNPANSEATCLVWGFLPLIDCRLWSI